jgi:hypothetical protein
MRQLLKPRLRSMQGGEIHSTKSEPVLAFTPPRSELRERQFSARGPLEA